MLEEHPIKTPPVFRYLRQKYIDEFFQSGRLRLTTFSEFAKHKDEQRLDPEEGWTEYNIYGEKQRVLSRAGVGSDAYILSTSLRGDTELMNAFGTDGYFKINDVMNFWVAVAEVIGCSSGRIGHCRYVNEREIHLRVGAPLDRVVEKNEQGKINRMRVVQLIREASRPQAYFLKLKRYAHQQEFRFVWQVGHEIHEHLFVECPEAIQFCEKIT